MKVFISWSTDLSHDVALILRDWLPTVLHTLEPWVSSEDINKGGRWSNEIAVQLQESKFGIICVTPHNAGSPWLNFEAGALSRTLPDAYVAPLLIGMSPSDLTGPLSQFQVTTAKKTEVKKLIESINKNLGDHAVPVERLRKTFDYCWPGLAAALGELDVPDKKVETATPLPHSPDDKTPNQPLQQIEEKILVAIAKGIEPSEEDYVSLDWVCSQVQLTPTRGKYHVEQMESKGLVRLDSYDECYLRAPGRAYLIERDLVQ